MIYMGTGKKKKEGKKKKPQLNNTHWEKARGEKRRKRKKRGNPEAEAKGASGQPLQVVLLPVNKESTNVLFGDTHFSFFSLPKNYYHPSLFKASLLCSAIPLKLLCFSVSLLLFLFSQVFSPYLFQIQRTVFLQSDGCIKEKDFDFDFCGFVDLVGFSFYFLFHNFLRIVWFIFIGFCNNNIRLR